MNLLSDLKMYGRFMRLLPGFLSHTIAADEARTIVRRRIAEREANFLRLVQRGVYGHERSPYLALLKFARAEFGDIQNLVRDKGLEGALTSLREAGVYVTFEEFKGRNRIVRHGKEILTQARDFDNPFLRPCYEIESGGSTGAGTRVGTDLEHLADRAANFLLAHEVHGTVNAPAAVWRGVLPDSSGINSILCSARMGNDPRVLDFLHRSSLGKTRPAIPYPLKGALQLEFEFLGSTLSDLKEKNSAEFIGVSPLRELESEGFCRN